MMECEKVDSVRQAVMKSLGILVAFTDDEDKFNEVMVMVMVIVVRVMVIVW